MPFSTINSLGSVKVTTSPTILTSSATGSQDNWAPGIGAETLISWSGASDMTVTGFAAGAAGRRITFLNVGSNVAYFTHQSGSSSAGNKLRNIATSGTTPVAPRGAATFEYDGTDWRLVTHDQGAWISVAYSAGNFTATAPTTWTVDSGDQITYQFKLVGSTLCMRVYLDTTSIASTSSLQLFVAIPNSFTSAKKVQGLALGFDNGVAVATYNRVDVASTTVEVGRSDVTAWANSTNNNYVRVNFDFEVN